MMDENRAETNSLASWCRWLNIGPGPMKIEHVKALINEIMAVSTLLAGFSIGMSSKVTDSAIRTYANFLKAEFFGKDSHYCTFDLPAKLPGAPSLSSLPAWDWEDPNSPNPSNAYCSAAENCWVGHWQTIDAAAKLGFEVCTMTADEAQQAYPDYWAKIVEEKVASVHIEMAQNTMMIIMTTVVVIVTGSLMRLSLVKRFDAPQAWLARFYLLLLAFVTLPLFNFNQFLHLASRSVRILWYYCDDYITTECYVTNTPVFETMRKGLMALAAVIWLLHLSLPSVKEDEEGTDKGGDTSRAYLSLSNSAAGRAAAASKEMRNMGAVTSVGMID